MSANLELVRRHVDAFNAADLDALLADFAPDATWVMGETVVPAEELPDLFGRAVHYLDPHLTLIRVVDGGDAVAVELHERWTQDGEAKDAMLLALLDVHEGKVRRGKVYREGSAGA
ncbi:MAG: SnoaL-like domain-containing protein [Actinomycetales bacterium]|nr:SnoaL-like domain-containing protein [Actinomycetales bacterium]